MTTASTSEQNERESMKASQATPSGDLEKDLMSESVAKTEREWFAKRKVESLQAKLNMAVNALEDIGSANWHFSMSRKLATEALAEINKGE